jgi:GAF domain-containing protein
MKPARKPENESARLEALEKYQILDTVSEKVYNEITKLAAEITGAPVAALNLVAEERQWTKAKFGIQLRDLPRDVSFCAHTILTPDQEMIVEDARYDDRFHDNPMTKGETPVIFYAGVPLVDNNGHALGSLCVVDHRPRTLPAEKIEALRALAKLIQVHFELRYANIQLEEKNDKLMLALPLVDTILNEIEVLGETDLKPDQVEQVEMLKDTTTILKTLFEQDESFLFENDESLT